ncbi:unnamed protein product [Eruca vesicaria subsp. sativa]|uniref:Cytochrome c oxidase subunit 5C n=1 Tax=Eruca vesicaria subsp. sativa TaxID=29727 RepID=A0ABC8M1J6_ERUVS|nr:unnamed protein product [Eruca vesicaria subsp. sativa]
MAETSGDDGIIKVKGLSRMLLWERALVHALSYGICWLRKLSNNEPDFGPLHLWLHESEEEKMAGHKIAHATLKGPSVVKELVIGLALGLAAGGLWKMHHWNEQRKTRSFYDLLEKDEISVVVAE